jgi:hypothetical protein
VAALIGQMCDRSPASNRMISELVIFSGTSVPKPCPGASAVSVVCDAIVRCRLGSAGRCPCLSVTWRIRIPAAWNPGMTFVIGNLFVLALQSRPAPRDTDAVISGIGVSARIALEHVAESYGEVRVVRSLDLVIAPGQTVALLAPGAGQQRLGW